LYLNCELVIKFAARYTIQPVTWASVTYTVSQDSVLHRGGSVPERVGADFNRPGCKYVAGRPTMIGSPEIITLNGISVRFAVFAQHTLQTDAQKDGPNGGIYSNRLCMRFA